jgi:uncharacterized protein with NRDE domain
MCLLIFAHQVSAQYSLALAANRDEFYARPTAPADFWVDYPTLLAGRDLEQGGTWMGITRCGRFAAVTNYRDPSRTTVAPRSRGELPLQYLTGQQDPQTFLDEIAPLATQYAGFNLLIGDKNSLWYFSNSSAHAGKAPQLLAPGIYGLSNAELDTPWPKVELGKEKLLQLLGTDHLSHEDLSRVVADRSQADTESLRRQGRDSAMEQILSAQFINTESYGTRSTTSLWIDNNGKTSWQERSYNELGALHGVQQEEFTRQ